MALGGLRRHCLDWAERSALPISKLTPTETGRGLYACDRIWPLRRTLCGGCSRDLDGTARNNLLQRCERVVKGDRPYDVHKQFGTQARVQ